MKTIVLNWMPPATPRWPSPAMSVLKSYLLHQHYEVSVQYWNLIFAELSHNFEFGVTKSSALDQNLLLWFNYLAIYKKDQLAYNKVRARLQTISPQYRNVSDNFYDEHMNFYAKKVSDLIDNIIHSYDFSKILFWGFEANIYQWVASSIIAEKIKEYSPSSVIVLGGIATANAAKAYLTNFPQFDFALWGEGEATLCGLAMALETGNRKKLLSLANIAYRDNAGIHVSKIPNNNYIDLSDSSMRFDFSDYFECTKKNNIKQKDISLPFEGSRSCHWKKCHFCYLNTGYKFRTKNTSSLCAEIEAAIKKYNSYCIFFVDNDIVVNDFNRFDELLDGLISIRQKYPQFTIESAEIITKNFSAPYIKKMALAGFKNVQIGYESPSNNLLAKIDKKNTFASNLLFIKFAKKYRIKIAGANIIQSLYEETDEDIVESINNIHYLRFFYADGYFRHSYARLSIIESSPYCRNKLNIKKESVSIDPIILFLPKDYIADNTKFTLLEHSVIDSNPLWNNFNEIDYFYTQHSYSYNFIINNGLVEYIEYFDNLEINRLEFDIFSKEWLILKYVNKQILSLDSLSKIEDLDQNKDEIRCIIDELYTEHLIYHNADYSEIIAIVDIEQTI